MIELACKRGQSCKYGYEYTVVQVEEYRGINKRTGLSLGEPLHILVVVFQFTYRLRCSRRLFLVGFNHAQRKVLYFLPILAHLHFLLVFGLLVTFWRATFGGF